MRFWWLKHVLGGYFCLLGDGGMRLLAAEALQEGMWSCG